MNWYVKEFSKLTRVSVRTLHYYDRLGLLKPSQRQPNGYRTYTSADLFKLQQILTLKFLGFSLKQIKTILQQGTTADLLRGQQAVLKKQLSQLQEAQAALDIVIKSAELPWDQLIKIMEFYQMKEDTKNMWVAEVLAPEQVEQFANIWKKYSKDEAAAYGEQWARLVAEVKAAMHEDPAGPTGQRLAKEWLALAEQLYGEAPGLKETLWQGFKQNKATNSPFAADVVAWIDKAFMAMRPQNQKK